MVGCSLPRFSVQSRILLPLVVLEMGERRVQCSRQSRHTSPLKIPERSLVISISLVDAGHEFLLMHLLFLSHPDRDLCLTSAKGLSRIIDSVPDGCPCFHTYSWF